MAKNKESKKVTNVEVDHFYGTIGLDGDQEKMRVPMKLKKYMKKEKKGLSGKAILRSPSGRYRMVKVSLLADGLFLKKGWGEFYQENNLCENDCLLFRHDGDKTMIYDVQIFCTHGLMKPVASNFGEERVCEPWECNACRPVKDEILSYDDQPETYTHRRETDVSEATEIPLVWPISMVMGGSNARQNEFKGKKLA
ncbi:unnamed protein product [Cuscuta epithymum]|uniref:TF-B3 domain-containing protein n=1 Tax=Cuscuta epithymum TaxID=186058 RepID=A0AAV0DUE6_9ASTE|nr:unnamed protein product [Cuscuta epithymum]